MFVLKLTFNITTSSFLCILSFVYTIKLLWLCNESIVIFQSKWLKTNDSSFVITNNMSSLNHLSFRFFLNYKIIKNKF